MKCAQHSISNITENYQLYWMFYDPKTKDYIETYKKKTDLDINKIKQNLQKIFQTRMNIYIN